MPIPVREFTDALPLKCRAPLERPLVTMAVRLVHDALSIRLTVPEAPLVVRTVRPGIRTFPIESPIPEIALVTMPFRVRHGAATLQHIVEPFALIDGSIRKSLDTLPVPLALPKFPLVSPPVRCGYRALTVQLIVAKG